MVIRFLFMSGLVLCVFTLFGPVAFLEAGSHEISGRSAGQGPHPALNPLAADGKMQISRSDRCPVCGMFPAKRPKYAAALVLKDGTTYYTCSNGCLLRMWRKSNVYLKTSAENIARMVVRNYFNGAPIDAFEAWWVVGSDVIGPMGPALVALANRNEVNQFRKRHGGRRVFQLKQINAALWREILPPKK